MSESSSTEGQSTTEGQEAGQQEGPDPTVVAQLKAEARKWEARAKANAGAQEKLDALEEAQKTEAQKLADRAKQAEEERDQAQAQLMRRDVASASGLPAEVADRLKGSTREELEQDAKSFAALLGDRQADARAASLVDPSAGKQAQAGSSVADQFAAAISNL